MLRCLDGCCGVWTMLSEVYKQLCFGSDSVHTPQITHTPKILSAHFSVCLHSAQCLSSVGLYTQMSMYWTRCKSASHISS